MISRGLRKVFWDYHVRLFGFYGISTTVGYLMLGIQLTHLFSEGNDYLLSPFSFSKKYLKLIFFFKIEWIIFISAKKRNKRISISVFLFNGISIFLGYLMPKPSLLKNSSGTIELIAGLRDNEFISFPRALV